MSLIKGDLGHLPLDKGVIGGNSAIINIFSGTRLNIHFLLILVK